MKKYKIDVEEVALLMETQEREDTNYFLDMETGETLAMPGEVMRAAEEGESTEGLPDWELQLLPQAREILEGSPRYIEIPVRLSREAYDLMVAFVRTLKDQSLQEEVYSALKGKGAFRRFKDALREKPEVEKEWFKFKAEKDKEEVKDWLESIGIELVED